MDNSKQVKTELVHNWSDWVAICHWNKVDPFAVLAFKLHTEDDSMEITCKYAGDIPREEEKMFQWYEDVDIANIGEGD